MVTCAPIDCKHKVSGSISLPSRGSFHLSLTVLFAIGHWVVFRLGGWALRLHTGLHVSGTTLVPPDPLPISSTGISPSASGLSRTLRLSSTVPCGGPQPPGASTWVWPLSRSLAATQEIIIYFLFLRVLRCFSSPGARHKAMNSLYGSQTLLWLGSPIRISADHNLFAVPRSFSQLTTSFIGVWCLGIHPALFVA